MDVLCPSEGADASGARDQEVRAQEEVPDVEIIEVIKEVMQTKYAKACAYCETVPYLSDPDDRENGRLLMRIIVSLGPSVSTRYRMRAEKLSQVVIETTCRLREMHRPPHALPLLRRLKMRRQVQAGPLGGL